MKTIFSRKSEEENTKVDENVEGMAVQPEKKPLATWIISVLVFGVLTLFTGLGVLLMYIKPSILPSINPWYVEQVIENASENTDYIEENKDSNEAIDEQKTDIVQMQDNKPTEADNNTDESSNADTEDNQDIEKPYVAGDDTKDNEIHTYMVIIGDYNWEEAYYDSRKYGDKAYLAHINSDEEYQYLSDLLTDHYSGYILWIGARRDSDKYIYKWTNAKNELVGDNICNLPYWLSNEPSFYDVSVNEFEYNVDMFYSKTEGRYVMNDVPTNILEYVPSYLGKMGYILEIED